ncbi:MAG TPA: C-GCAxxG-C-C family protein [Bacillota bacterium]|mgnify:CR=1 FL=1|jgi:C_GCAxxG_C_C family probable redox protein|nr:C_GCAxxG_C_C family protein [Fastidiosipila sp.]HPX93438.1 C-GCAxxG-C-C family protein [Bacillota bacterium]HQB81210.1 C-GCAxxG-C-C family protein [Bacillota bacterium]
MNFEDLIAELKKDGLGGCSQVMAKLGLELTGRENPDLIRAMSGLTGGMGSSGSACGVLTGGAATLGYYMGKGQIEDIPHPDYKEAIRRYVDWFRETYGTDRCEEIIHGDKEYSRRICPGIIEAGYHKMTEILEEYGVLNEPCQ